MSLLYSVYIPLSISIGSTLFIIWGNHRYLNKAALGSLRNQWLKTHYDEIVKEMYNPSKYMPNVIGENVLKYFQPIPGIMFTKGDNRFEFQVNDHGGHFIRSNNLYNHLKAAEYNEIFKKLEEATKNIHGYVCEVNHFFSKIKKSIQKVIQEFAPEAEPAENYNQNKQGYILSNIIMSIISQLTQNGGEFEVGAMEGEPSHPMLTIKGPKGSAVTVPTNLPKLKEFVGKLNSIHNEFAWQADGIIKKKQEIGRKWDSFMESLKQVQEDYRKSGIPIEGKCEVCKKTKKAKSLMPP